MSDMWFERGAGLVVGGREEWQQIKSECDEVIEPYRSTSQGPLFRLGLGVRVRMAYVRNSGPESIEQLGLMVADLKRSGRASLIIFRYLFIIKSYTY